MDLAKTKEKNGGDENGNDKKNKGGESFFETIRTGLGGPDMFDVLSGSVGALNLGSLRNNVAANSNQELSPGSPDAPSDRNLSREGYALLELLFPLLHIEADMESCPKCHEPLSKAEVMDGFTDDPNNYTTQCPREGCGKRFVAYFSVLCSSPDWHGTQGPQTPLYFTALSPWVLRKEVLTLLVDSRGDGKKKAPPSSTKKSTSSSSCGGTSSSKTGDSDRVGAAHLRLSSSTIFWNLVLYFRLFGLPCEFLVDPEEAENQGAE